MLSICYLLTAFQKRWSNFVIQDLGTETVSCACGLLLRKANLTPGRVISLCDPGIEVDRHGLKLEKKLDQLPQVCQHACTNRQKNYIMAGAHKSERATSMYSCHGVFTDQFIFKKILVQI